MATTLFPIGGHHNDLFSPGKPFLRIRVASIRAQVSHKASRKLRYIRLECNRSYARSGKILAQMGNESLFSV